MKRSASKRPRIQFRPLRIAVRLLGVLSLLLLGGFAFLRIEGVPDQILQNVVQRANEAGIPIGIDKLRLTARGWRGDNVRYFSLNAADKEPTFQAGTVYFGRHSSSGEKDSSRWKYDIEAQGVEISPSVEWGVEIPQDSQTRTIECIQLTLAFLPDRIEFSDGSMKWWNSLFSLNGTILKATPETKAARIPKAPKEQKTLFPVFIDEASFRKFENRINEIQIDGDDTVTIHFHIDVNDYQSSTLDFEWKAEDFNARGGHYSRATVSASYGYPTIKLEEVAVHKQGGVAALTGSYDLATKLLNGNLSNTITSNEILKALPATIHSTLDKLDMQFGQLPQLELTVGPCTASNALNTLSGNFSLQDFTYCGSTIESIAGNLERKNNRLELSDLSGTMQGLEHLASETGSGMIGGPATGSVYFDSNDYWFGVDADLNLDPTLLMGPLSSVRIATNVLDRFKFNGKEAPRGHLILGSCVTNWSTFFIDIQMQGDEVTIHDAQLSHVDVTAAYSNKVLRLEPLTAMQDTNKLTGTVSLSFKNKTAEFDLLTNIDPLTLQNAAYPPLGVFGKSIKTSGVTITEAHGLIDWKSMMTTDFIVEIESQQVDLPVAQLTDFAGTVTGKGPHLSVTNTQFNIFGGRGSGMVMLDIDPTTNALPYRLDLNLAAVNFSEAIRFFNPDTSSTVTGNLKATIQLDADLQQSFFEAANGVIALNLTDGQLADLPFFQGFSKLTRKLFPAFNTFSIHSYSGTLNIKDGVIRSEDSYFEGDVLSAKANGRYRITDGFNVTLQVQTLNSRLISRMVRVITDPILEVFKIKLTGTLSDPSWEFKKF